MSKRQWLMVFGAIIILLPFLGFPANWNTVMLVIIGLIVIVLAYRLSAPDRSKGPPSGPFIEHRREPKTPEADSLPSDQVSESIINNSSRI